MNRRSFLHHVSAATAGCALAPASAAETEGNFRLHYLLGSAMYGSLPLEVVMDEAPKTGARALDIWPRRHGSQREQMDELGHAKVAAMLEARGLRIACLTRYDLGPFKLEPEFAVAKAFGAGLIVTGAAGPKGLSGLELKKAVGVFVEQMKPHALQGMASGVRILIENHGKSLIDSPDSLRWLVEFAEAKGTPLGVILAPYHLPQEPELLAALIRDLGARLGLFCAWQHGMGCTKPMPKEQELMQMPGRGTLDFRPLLKALKDIRYEGWTQVFMHPTPRGIPILPTAAETTAEINRSRAYLDGLLADI